MAAPIVEDLGDAIRTTTITANGQTVTVVPKAGTPADNESQILIRAQNALAVNQTFLGLVAPTNAQVLAQTKALTRECSALIRLLLNQLTDISDT